MPAGSIGRGYDCGNYVYRSDACYRED